MTPFANPQTSFVPPAVTITNITNSYPCLITTSEPHGYTTGIFCTIVIPYPNVMPEINGQTYYMFVPAPNQLVPIIEFLASPYSNYVFLDSTNFGAFSLGPMVTCTPHAPLPPVPFQVPAQSSQVVPSGEFVILDNASDVIGPRNLPGS